MVAFEIRRSRIVTWLASWPTPLPVGVGSRLDFVARFLGRTLAYTYEVVEHGPDRLVMRTEQGPFPDEDVPTPGNP
jgi:hypothetical protein